ncbi:MAG: DUF1552 domain-containing protein [Myxococcota bacterium]
MKYNRIHRRHFLQGIGGALLTVPILPSLLPREARAQAMNPPKRFIGLKHWNAPPVARTWPTSSGIRGDYTVRPYALNRAFRDGTTELSTPLTEPTGNRSGNRYFGHWAPLSDFIGTEATGDGFSTMFGRELNPFRDKMLYLRGLHFPASVNHNNGGWLGNFAASENPRGSRANATLDQVLANSSEVYATAPIGPRSISLSPGQFASIVFDDSGSGITPVIDPVAAWTSLFGRLDGGSEGETPADHPRRNLVNRIYEDFRAVRGSAQISNNDRQRLDRHVGFLNDLQVRLQSSGSVIAGGSCSAPGEPPARNLNSVEEVRSLYNDYLDLIAAAVMCDVTRVFTLNCCRVPALVNPGVEDVVAQGCGSCNSGEGNPNFDQAGRSWHYAAHSYGSELSDPALGRLGNRLSSAYEFIGRRVMAGLLERLDVPEDGESTYLDNSVVLLGGELGSNHVPDSVPTALAGSLGGYFDTGKYLDYMRLQNASPFVQENGTFVEGAHYNRLLIAILQGFGLTASDYETEPGTGLFGESRMLGRSNVHWGDMDPDMANRPLNGIVA